MTQTEALAILSALANGEPTANGSKLLFSERYALKGLLGEREAVDQLLAKFRERELTNSRLSKDIESKSLEKALKFAELSLFWAAVAAELERVLRGVRDA